MLYGVDSFPYEEFRKRGYVTRPKGNNAGKTKRNYINAICAFDIETTRLRDIEQSIMYIWQFAIEDDVIFGRTWEEYISFLERISSGLKPNDYIVVYVHNLSYEFQFLRGIFSFNTDEVFCMAPRKILKATHGNIEYRCSYIHSNMSLSEYSHKMGVPDAKLSGFDYNKVRYPWTPLTDEEIAYCINDVKGLVQALRKEMEIDGDTLYTIPLTSTGYVRRDVKAAMHTFNRQRLAEMQPDINLYRMMREAFRGGNTHANRYYADTIVSNVKSKDIKSSYPAQQCMKDFPMGKWMHEDIENVSIDYVLKKIVKRKRCMLARILLQRPRLHNPLWGCPYLTQDKSRNLVKPVLDNGRVLAAEWLETTITEIDLSIILEEYDFDNIIFLDVYSCRSGPLPEQWRRVNLDYFHRKTALQGIPGEEIYYMKAKNKLNSVYGMSVQDPAKRMILYDPETAAVYRTDDSKSLEQLLSDSARWPYRSYAWGIWTTAHARRQLEDGLKIVGAENFIYCDTDSVKYIGEADFTEYNNQIKKIAIEKGCAAEDSKGNTYYMGVYEDDGYYQYFRTMGAKKYCYVDYNGFHVTIAGVNKKKGAAEMKNPWNFKEGFIFKDAGGTRSIYNDFPEIGSYNAEGHTIPITSNVVIAESEYTLGVTGDYRKILNSPALWVDAFGEYE